MTPTEPEKPHYWAPTPADRAQWRVQSERAAVVLKSRSFGDKEHIKMAFVFKDMTVTVGVPASHIRELPGPELAKLLYNLVEQVMLAGTEAGGNA
jgi:hypothetical protein